MSFKFEEGKMYMMPVVFGPCVTPRQKPEGGRWIYDSPTKTTHYLSLIHIFRRQSDGNDRDPEHTPADGDGQTGRDGKAGKRRRGEG